MRIAVIGAGYVGLVTAAGFASRGHSAVCADINQAKIAALTGGKVPWFEPGLDDLVRTAAAKGLLSFTTDTAQAVAGAELVLIAVGTPPREDGSADTRWIFSAAQTIATRLSPGAAVVVRSTTPAGTARSVRGVIKQSSGKDVAVLSNPEFLREGLAVKDFLNPDRVVIGADRSGEEKPLTDLYMSVAAPERIIVMDTVSAEMSKYASNAFLATKISFMNQVADLCDALGADIEHVRRVMGLDPRIGGGQLRAGLGYGGSCLPKDTKALMNIAAGVSLEMPIVRAAEDINSQRPALLAGRIAAHFGGSISGKRVAIWGLAFKPGTDDMREAPALPLVRLLTSKGASVVAYDPVAAASARSLLDGAIEYAPSAIASVNGADAIVLVTEWEEFLKPDWTAVRQAMRTPVIFDGRNVYDPKVLAGQGFAYYGIGRGGAPAGARAPAASASTPVHSAT
jgi:UDPglucose 6-dehydrogenase